MIVKFKGLIERKPKIATSGCQTCGKKGLDVSGYTRVTRKEYLLPSGRRLNVVIGREYEVNDMDGMFLLSQAYQYENEPRNVFEVV